MNEQKILKALYATVNQLEYQLAQLGDDLAFQVRPGGGLEIVHRSRDDRSAEPTKVVAQLRGADPLLWQAERPEGGLVLGMPYGEAEPRCVRSGRELPRGAPVDLYFRGQPIDVEHAYSISPHLVLLHGLATTFDALLLELWLRMPRAVRQTSEDEDGSAPENPIAAQVRDWFRELGLTDREPLPKTDDIPEEN
ncbi:MAG: hypothetical protein AAF657_40055 [Acidobacteriota bacterium]